MLRSEKEPSLRKLIEVSLPSHARICVTSSLAPFHSGFLPDTFSSRPCKAWLERTPGLEETGFDFWTKLEKNYALWRAAQRVEAEAEPIATVRVRPSRPPTPLSHDTWSKALCACSSNAVPRSTSPEVHPSYPSGRLHAHHGCPRIGRFVSSGFGSAPNWTQQWIRCSILTSTPSHWRAATGHCHTRRPRVP